MLDLVEGLSAQARGPQYTMPFPQGVPQFRLNSALIRHKYAPILGDA